MSNATRQSNAAARERLEALTDHSAVDTSALAGDLLAVTDLLDREAGLRGTLTDPGIEGQRKADLVTALFDGRIGAEALDLVSGLVRSRWSATRDLADTCEQLAFLAEIIGADRADALDETEDELFRFGRIVSSSGDLRAALTDRRAPAEAKAGLLRSLLEGRANRYTEQLLSRLVTQPRGRSLDAGIDALTKLAAARRDRVVAVVVSAVPLNDTQKRRLGEALARIYGRQVHLNLDVDPAVLGGVSVRIGDEVINGTIADRLDEASRRMAG
ncbi:F0F1 ATP synthase subunit delta [Streptomyces sp. TS71-3]|uniref:F0F1 ATP synthase subunit delta n=1 Tax=Streptomyces sp. TS71-3 TaxID=2733862 RepID=UPI001B235082|nr:F0F1 ATP synthase subunit delta [Streptomyces sp. TS71-3]GHJ36063.1 ATP synthase subunit delta [Streptomyces sp. TS71-3]